MGTKMQPKGGGRSRTLKKFGTKGPTYKQMGAKVVSSKLGTKAQFGKK